MENVDGIKISENIKLRKHHGLVYAKYACMQTWIA